MSARRLRCALLLVALAGAGIPARAEAGLAQRFAVAKLAVKRVVQRTSLEVSFGLTFAPPAMQKVANVSIGGSLWSGDAVFWKHRAKFKDTLLNGRVQIATLAGGYTRNTLSGDNWSVNLPYLGGYYAPSGRAYGISLGIPNLASLGVGEVRSTKDTEYARGPYVGVGGAVHLFGSFHLSIGATLFSPAFAPLAKPLAKPAMKLKVLGDKMKEGLQRLVGKRPTAS